MYDHKQLAGYHPQVPANTYHYHRQATAMPEAITSLNQFLQQMEVKLRLYDLGRRINKLSREDFIAFEATETAYPHPYLHHAWLGLVFWSEDNIATPSVWFLRFPLDEQGKLIPAARDEFLKQLLTSVGSNLEAMKSDRQLKAVLENNPYVFTPPQEKQACFNAIVKATFKQPASQFHASALDYLRQGDYGNWQGLGMQGFADLAARWQEREHHALLLQALPQLPSEPLSALCQCLEHQAIDVALTESIQRRIQQTLQQCDANNSAASASLLAALLRGLSHSQAAGLRLSTIEQLLQHPVSAEIELLAALSTRCSSDIAQPQLSALFLEQLAQHSQDSFNRIMADLLFQAREHNLWLAALRQPKRSERLAQAIGQLLSPSEPTKH